LPLDNVSIRLGDSSRPQSPVEGGSWIAASVSHAIAATAEEVRKELLALAKRMKDSPLAGAKLEDVTLSGGALVSKHEPSRAVSIADAIRHGAVDRIQREETNSFRDI